MVSLFYGKPSFDKRTILLSIDTILSKGDSFVLFFRRHSLYTYYVTVQIRLNRSFIISFSVKEAFL